MSSFRYLKFALFREYASKKMLQEFFPPAYVLMYNKFAKIISFNQVLFLKLIQIIKLICLSTSLPTLQLSQLFLKCLEIRMCFSYCLQHVFSLKIVVLQTTIVYQKMHPLSCTQAVWLQETSKRIQLYYGQFAEIFILTSLFYTKHN